MFIITKETKLMKNLPTELKCLIFTYNDITTLLNASCACKEWSSIINSVHFKNAWNEKKIHYKKNFGRFDLYKYSYIRGRIRAYKEYKGCLYIEDKSFGDIHNIVKYIKNQVPVSLESESSIEYDF